MTKAEFLARLRQGLGGLPPSSITDICSDYEAHFADGAEAGRTEAEVAKALGDPGRLARELRAETSLKRWEETRSPSAGAAAIFAVLGLGAVDILILLPILVAVISVLFGLFVSQIFAFFAGGVIFAVGPFSHPPGGPAAALLFGLGCMATAVGVLSLLTLCCVGLVNALVWYGRLHFRLLKPAID